MISTSQRENAEKVRSAREASQATSQLLVPPATIARYLAPPESTAFPLEYAFHLLGDIKGKTVLEYGCGDGLNTVVLANRGAKVIALDISAELLAVARQRVEENGCGDEVEFLLGSAHDLPLADGSVDVVFGMAILHHLDLDLASREVWRVLKGGGRAIFEEPVRNSRVISWARQFLPAHGDVSPYEHPLTNEQIKDFARPHTYHWKTFQLALSSIASFFPFWKRRAIRFSARVDSYLLRLCPPLAHYGTVKVFQIAKANR